MAFVNADRAHTWPGAELFSSLIEEAARRANIKVYWVADGWIVRLEKDGQSCHVAGTYFPLNNSTSSHIAEDKVATFVTLEQAGVPAVQHEMIPHHIAREENVLDDIIGRIGLPAVIKPATGKGGVDVHKADARREARNLVRRLLEHYRSLAISPLEEVVSEYRVVVLDDRPLLIYKKLLDQSEWRHNLRFGARPTLEESPAIRAELSELSRSALRAIGGRFMSVDIIETPDTRKVLEINAGVMLNGFAAMNSDFRGKAASIYREALIKCFE